MVVLKAIKERRSIRRFRRGPIPDEAVEALVEALIWAPSAGNLQSRKFYFIFNEDLKERLAEAALGQEFIAQAPLVVVACADHRIERRYGRRGKELYALQDVATSVQNLLLEAHELGLGAVWVGAFHEEAVKAILDLPNYLRPVTLIPIGLPDEEPLPPERLPRRLLIEVRR